MKRKSLKALIISLIASTVIFIPVLGTSQNVEAAVTSKDGGVEQSFSGVGFVSTNTKNLKNVVIEPEYMQTIARSQLPMINSWRAGTTWYYDSSNTKVYKNGLKALKYDYTLEKYAMQRAAEIIVSFEHKRPSGEKSGLGQFGYIGNGENIAVTMDPKGIDAKHIFELFKEDEYPYSGQGHRRNMLSAPYSWDCVGIACVRYNDCYYWVQTFGMTDKPDTIPTPAINGFRKMTVQLNPNILESKSADLTNLNEWVPKIKKGQTVELPEIDLKVRTEKTFPHWQIPVCGIPEWTSSNDSVVKINSEEQTITGVNAGSANVTMKEPITGTSKTVKVTVEDDSVPVKSVSIDVKESTLAIGEEKTLKATVDPSNASDKRITWSSSNPSVATVDKNGKVKAVKAGNATITAKTRSGGKTDSFKVAVLKTTDNGAMTLTVNDKTDWFFVKNGVVDYSYTGLARDTKGNWYFMTKGKYDKTYLGTSPSTTNPKGQFFVKNGTWDRTYTGLAHGLDKKWYFVTNGQYDKKTIGTTGSTTNPKGQFFVKNGTWDRTYTGLAKNVKDGKWYYVTNGQWDKKFVGLSSSTTNSKKVLYVKNGVWQSSYSGKITFNNKTYTIKAGKVV